MEDLKHIVIFDGYCNLCNGFVDFLIKHDKQKKLVCITLQSDAGVKLAKKHRIPDDVDSVVFIEGDRYYILSDAVLKVVQQLPYPWKALSVFFWLTRKLRDKTYRFIASRRYRIWGKRESCRVL